VTPGQVARRLLGPWFPYVGRIYRRLAVDLQKVAEGFPRLPEGAHILDVGGGDGELMNYLLPLNPGVQATLIDIIPNLGEWIAPELRSRVDLLPNTSVTDLAAREHTHPDLVILSDVVHHVPMAERARLFEDLRGLLDGKATKLVIKDVEPGSWRSKVLYLADRYITGDPNVEFLPRTEMRRLVEGVFPGATCLETNLFSRNAPNYCLVFSLTGKDAAT
jgi:cyclopropane fatty-acyl-phospholipid synthase-like methyltransferase